MFIFLVCLVGCKNPNVVPKSDYIRVKDSLTVLISQNKINALKVLKLTDSINSGILMTKQNHLEIVNYERLLKYYRICKNNPSQWIFYKGWSIRVFEGDQ